MNRYEAICSCIISFVLVAGSAAAAAPSYVGAKKCKMCHMSAKSGAQYKVWQASKHARAYEALTSEKAAAIAKQRGIAEPQKSSECLSCHAPASAVKADLKKASYTVEEGVSCEACHGPGSDYMKMSVMKAIAAGKQKPEEKGLVKPTEAVCKGCHNEKSPTFNKDHPFVFKEMYEKIKHEKPKG